MHIRLVKYNILQAGMYTSYSIFILFFKSIFNLFLSSGIKFQLTDVTIKVIKN